MGVEGQRDGQRVFVYAVPTLAVYVYAVPAMALYVYEVPARLYTYMVSGLENLNEGEEVEVEEQRDGEEVFGFRL